MYHLLIVDDTEGESNNLMWEKRDAAEQYKVA